MKKILLLALVLLTRSLSAMEKKLGAPRLEEERGLRLSIVIPFDADESDASHSLNMQLIAAVQTYRISMALKLLAQGANPDTRSPRTGNSVLHLAVKGRAKKLVLELLKRGADIFALNNESQTIFDFAQDDVMRNILNEAVGLKKPESSTPGSVDHEKKGETSGGEKRKKDPELEKPRKRSRTDGSEKKQEKDDADRESDHEMDQSKNGLEKLDKATLDKRFLKFVGTCQTPKVKECLELGADITVRDELGNTALHRAAQRNSNPLISLLLSHGADLHAINAKGQKPVDMASPTVKSLLEQSMKTIPASLPLPEPLEEERAEVHLRPDTAITSQTQAAKKTSVNLGDERLEAVIMEDIDDIFSKDEEVGTPEVLRGEKLTEGHVFAMPPALVIAKPPQPSQVPSAQPAPGMLPVMGYQEESISDRSEQPVFYMDAATFAFIDVRLRFNNQTVLHRFIDQDIGLMRYFLIKGADVNAQDGDGNTPLILAAKRNNLPLMALLLEYKADMNMRNKESKVFTDYVNRDIKRLIEALIGQ